MLIKNPSAIIWEFNYTVLTFYHIYKLIFVNQSSNN